MTLVVISDTAGLPPTLILKSICLWYNRSMTVRKTDKFTATYQTRIRGNEDALAAYANLDGTLQRHLFADVSAGHPASSLKSDYISRYGIPARMFNAMRVTLEGRMSAARESQKLYRETLQGLIARASRRITNLGRKGKLHQVHHKRRRLENLRHRLEKVESDIDADRLRLCFGSKRLWRAQHSLEANGYADHAEWLSDWRDARGNEFFVLGSRDENAGCQLCVAAVADDGSLTLRLRMPDCLAEQSGKYITVENVRFAYGHERIVAALQSNADYRRHRKQHGERAVRATQLGQAISYRFKRDRRGWRVFATTDIAKASRDGPQAGSGWRGPERRPSSGHRDRPVGQRRQCLLSAARHLWKERTPGRGAHRRCRLRCGGLCSASRQAPRDREAGLPAQESRA